MGRPAIGDRAMTAAERKARSRANGLGTVKGLLELAERDAAAWERCMKAGRPGATDEDIKQAFGDLAVMIQNAILALPRS